MIQTIRAGRCYGFSVLVLVLLASGALAEASGDLPKDFPVSVRLAKGLKSQPALPLGVANSLYYTFAQAIEIPNQGGCRGRDIYRFAIEEQKQVRLAELSCVVDLFTDGKTGYVSHRENGTLRLSRLLKDRIEPAITDAAMARVIASFAFKRDGLNLSRSPLDVIAFGVSGEKIFIVARSQGDTPYLFGKWVDRITQKPTSNLVLAIPFEGSLDEIVISEEHPNPLYVIQREDDKRLGRVIKVNLKTSSLEVMGGDRVLSGDISQGDLKNWSIRSPRLLSSGFRGVLIADRTPFVFQERRQIHYLSGDGSYRVLPIPAEDLGGVREWRGGILVSRPLVGEIVWYGEKNPFEKLTEEGGKP